MQRRVSLNKRRGQTASLSDDKEQAGPTDNRTAYLGFWAAEQGVGSKDKHHTE